jgi:hypothetical protein
MYVANLLNAKIFDELHKLLTITLIINYMGFVTLIWIQIPFLNYCLMTFFVSLLPFDLSEIKRK